VAEATCFDPADGRVDDMKCTDPIADLLTRIRNSLQSRKAFCEVPASKEKENILKILKAEGFIKNFVRQEEYPQDKLIVFLKYVGKNQKSVINQLRRVSKPGCRVYRGYREIRPVLSGLGFSILSTPKGIITDKEAKQVKLGGEVICEVW
jgi:small subunit ribosomal protein S8